MTGLLTILILLGITIAIWQMVKIFDLAQVNKDLSQVANDNDNKVHGYLMLAFLGFIYGITIVSFALWGDLPLTSNSASEHGPEIDRLMIISMVVIFIVQTKVKVESLIFYLRTYLKSFDKYSNKVYDNCIVIYL